MKKQVIIEYLKTISQFEKKIALSSHYKRTRIYYFPYLHHSVSY